MNRYDNIKKAVWFENPEYIPMTFHINDSCWQNYSQDYLFDLMESHKLLFPDFKQPKTKYVPNFSPVARKDEPFTDDFGCIWETMENGIVGTVKKHPLADWKSFDNYKAPDPNICMGVGPIKWDEAALIIEKQKGNGDIASGGLRHGHTFLQLCDLRGYENLIFDMADDEPDLKKLITVIEDFNLFIVNKYLSLGAEIMAFPEDLGMQNGPMLSPEHFKKFIKPSYQNLISCARNNDAIIHMHSDGYIHDFIDDLLDCGVDIINLQDLVNGIDWISGRFAGKICIEVDIDRQFITPKGTHSQIDGLIREEVEKIGNKDGGLMMIYGLYPGVNPDNIEIIMNAMEKYAFYYS